MAQRILDPHQIEASVGASVPRLRLPDTAKLFRLRAARLARLADDSPIGDYLRFLARLAEAQDAARSLPMTDGAEPDARLDALPPLHPACLAWQPGLDQLVRALCAAVLSHRGLPPALIEVLKRLKGASPEWLQAQAQALLGVGPGPVDGAAAPLIMASLQVRWSALAERLVVGDDVSPGPAPACPLCGSLPVTSKVYGEPGLAGYRFLQCELCAAEWHRVRVHCTHCGAGGKDIGYFVATPAALDPAHDGAGRAPVRAETCEQCHGYRKILYQESDPGVESLADDLASLRLDLLLGEKGYHRLSRNPLLWQPETAN